MAALSAAAMALLSLPAGGVAGVTGVGGSGKTTTAQAAADHAFKAGLWPRQIAFDVYAGVDRRRWARGSRDRKPWWPDAPLLTVDELLERPELLSRPKFRLVVYSPAGERDEQRAGADFSALATLILDAQDLTLFGEEFGKYGRAPGAFELINTLATGGGHYGVRFIAICQRIGRIHIDTREAMSVLAIHACGGEDDIDAIRGRCGKPLAEKARALRARCDAGCIEEHKHVRVPDAPLRWRQGERAEERS